MSKSEFSERERKASFIADMYRDRKYTQYEIAEELNMSERGVRKVLQAYDFEHTKEKSNSDPNNLNPGQTVNAIIDYKALSFLDKYDF